MRNSLQIVMVLATAVGLSGCRGWLAPAPDRSSGPQGQSLLKPVELASNGFKLEVVSVRFPLGDPELNDTAWLQIDEQQIPPEVRRKLAVNGFRVGVVSGQPPPEIARLLVAEQPATFTQAAANIANPPVVSRQQMQLHSGWHGQLIASRVYDEIPLLVREDGDLAGRPYRLAQGIWKVSALSLGDRRVKLQFTPELHHGESRQTFVTESEDGQLRPQLGKEKRVFDRLAFEATLASGQMLVLASLPDRPGTLGHYFFTEPQVGQLQQKLILVRLGQTRYSDLCAPITGEAETRGEGEKGRRGETMNDER